MVGRGGEGGGRRLDTVDSYCCRTCVIGRGGGGRSSVCIRVGLVQEALGNERDAVQQQLFKVFGPHGGKRCSEPAEQARNEVKAGGRKDDAEDIVDADTVIGSVGSGGGGVMLKVGA